MKQAQLFKSATKRQSFITDLRHQLHKIPELGWKEEKTLECIKQAIAKIKARSSLSFDLTEKKGGIWVDLNFSQDFEWLLFRADVDGLPIKEATNLPFSSKYEGRMHACGHDCHSAMLLGALDVLATESPSPCYNIRFVWQRAEEVGAEPSGGSELVKEGVLDGMSYVYGLHISSAKPYGVMLSRPGPLLCSPDRLEIEVSCSGGHVMYPEVGSSATDILADIQLKLRTAPLLHFGPLESILLIPSIVEAKVAHNVRPDRGRLCYAFRHFLDQQRLNGFIQVIKSQVESIISSYPSAHLTGFHHIKSYPMLNNDPANYAFVSHLLEEQGLTVEESKPLFGGEDFAYYLAKRPGSFWFLGAEGKVSTQHHTPLFNPEESILHQGTAFWLLLAHTPHPS